MPYPINQNDIAQVTLVTHLPNVVKCLNTFHFRYLDPGVIVDGHAALLDLAQTVGNAALTTGYVNRWQQLASDVAVIENVWAQKVYPVRYGKVDFNVNIVGVRVEDPIPGCTQFTISRRGDIAARYAQGNIRVPGLADALESLSQLHPDAIPIAEAMALWMRTDLTTPLGVHWRPIIYRRNNPGSSVDVVETRVNNLISTQRSRVAFRGI